MGLDRQPLGKLISRLRSIGLLGVFSLILATSCTGGKTSTTFTDDPPTLVLPSQTSLPATNTPTPEDSTQRPPIMLPAEDARKEVGHLLHYDPACRLPCWWGVHPGTSNFLDTTSFYTRFEEIMFARTLDADEGFDWIGLSLAPPGLELTVTTVAHGSFVGSIHVSSQLVDQASRELVFNSPRYFEAFDALSPSAVLEGYGPPEGAYLRATTVPWKTSSLLMSYVGQGFLVEYQAENGFSVVDNELKVSFCPAAGFVALTLLSPGSGMNTEDAYALFGLFDGFRELENSTDLTIDELVRDLSAPGCAAPIMMPARYWQDR